MHRTPTYLFLAYSTSSTVLTGFSEWTSVHHHSVCLLAQHYDEFILNSKSQPVYLGFSEWTSVSPLCMPSRKALRKTSYWAFNSHAIDNEHSTLVPWTYNLFDCRQLLPLTSRLVASMSGLANNCSITTLYVLYATTLWKDPHSSYTPTSRTKPIGFLPRYGRYEVFGSTFYTLRPSNRHYSPSKSFSPSSQYTTLEKKNLTCGVHGHWTLLWSRRVD